MSDFSPGPVQGTETLVRFLFDNHVRKSKIRNSAYDLAFRTGCSTQRHENASNSELAQWLRSFLRNNSERSWQGVTTAACSAVRQLKLEGADSQLFCVYDTAEHGLNPSHAEICISRVLGDEGEQNEARVLIRKAFRNDDILSPHEYRNGEVLEMMNLTVDNSAAGVAPLAQTAPVIGEPSISSQPHTQPQSAHIEPVPVEARPATTGWNWKKLSIGALVLAGIVGLAIWARWHP